MRTLKYAAFVIVMTIAGGAEVHAATSEVKMDQSALRASGPGRSEAVLAGIVVILAATMLLRRGMESPR